jgi:hypothetical protein
MRYRLGLCLLALLLLISPSNAKQRTTVFLPLIKASGAPVTVTIDHTVRPSRQELPGMRDGPPRPVGAFAQEGAPQVEFVTNEVRIRPRSAADLEAFLNKYGGVVIHDGSIPQLPGLEAHGQAAAPPDGRYLVRIDLQRVPTDRLVQQMEQAGARGAHRFSSRDAAQLIALITGERGWQISPNLLLHGNAILEHPDGKGGNLDAATWKWMSEDDDPNQPDDQGLSVGVVHAWDYLAYHNLPPRGGGAWQPPLVAIIDGSFTLDRQSGIPLYGNQDYFTYGDRPFQYDALEQQPAAGGANPGDCGSPCPWHGQHAFGVAAARARNGYGTAGIAGPVAVPLLIRVDKTSDTIERGIKTAAANGADVISISLGFGCPVVTWICTIPWDDPWADMRSAVNFALARGAIVVASAGNDGKAYYDDKYIPCGLHGVICVGAVRHDQQAADYSNWGPAVDIWAPTDIATTPDPTTAGKTGWDALPIFSGTSAATPFVAGVIALMRTLHPGLTADEALAILVDTANTSPDPKVTTGYVDAYRAVQRVRANQPPTITLVSPEEGERVSWRAAAAYFHAIINDPETAGLFRGAVSVSSERDGLLCVDNTGASTNRMCSGPELSLGTHRITMQAIDAHSAEASVSRTIEVVNSAPTTQISYPADQAQFSTSQTINFRGSASDVDELIPNAALVWTSDRQGRLGAGHEIDVRLSEGTHRIQLAALDRYSASGSSSITVLVRVGAGIPTARILQPQPNSLFSPDMMIAFVGTGSDPEDGQLSGERLRWYSDIDGYLGSGANLNRRLSGPAEPCYPETISHTITLEAIDSDGNIARHQIMISVGTIC